MLQDRWAKAERASATKADVLVVVRCPDCRSTLARVYSTEAGALFEARIEASKLDQLEQKPPPWLKDRRQRELPEEALSDDGQLLTEYTRPNTPRMPYDKLGPAGDHCIVMDLLEPPPAPDGGVSVPLWVRCHDHPRTPGRAEGRPSVIRHLKRYHPAGGTAVSRQALITAARLALQSRQCQDHEVPRPSTP